MIRITAISFLVLFSVSGTLQSQPCTSATGKTVTVNGSATLRLVPDRVSFSVGVETETPNVGEAFTRNTDKVNAVISAFKEQGVKSQEIQTSNFTITSHDDEGKKLGGYRVTNRVTVTRKDTSSVGKLLQLAVSRGANEAGPIQFSATDQREAELHGLEVAFQNARTKAEKLAALAGKSLGGAVCMSESEIRPTYYSPPVDEITVSSEAPSIETGAEPLTVTVSAVFELK